MRLKISTMLVTGKKMQAVPWEVLKFTANLEENLINIQNELIWKTYQPRAVRQFYVTEPKKRLITAPAFHDRVVHHACITLLNHLDKPLSITAMLAEITRVPMRQ